MLINLSQDGLRADQGAQAGSAQAGDLAFVPSGRTTADAHRGDGRLSDDGRPTLNRTDNRKRAENAGRVDVPLEELRLLASHAHAGERWSAQRTSRLRVGLLIAGLVAVAALLGWQHRGDEVKEVASSSMASIWPAAPKSPSRVATAESETVSASRAEAASAGASEPAPAQTTPPDQVAGVAVELQQQIQSIAYDLSVMKQNLEQLATKSEQLASKQEQTAREIASLRAVKPDNKATAGVVRPRSVESAPRTKPPGLPSPAPRALPPEQISAQTSSPTQPVVRPPPQQDAVVRPPSQQDVVVRPPMPLRQE